MALHWICGGGEYRQFVENRVRKVQNHEVKSWRHVPTGQNPADLGSRGGPVSNNDLWWKGPAWLPHSEQWPQNPATNASEESEAEAKMVKKVMAIAIDETDEFD